MVAMVTCKGSRGRRNGDPLGGKEILWVKRLEGIDICYPVAGKGFRNGMDALVYHAGCQNQEHPLVASNWITWEVKGKPCGFDIEVVDFEHASRLAKREIVDLNERRKA